MNSRVKTLAFVYVIGFSILLLKLIQIQLFETEHYSKRGINLLNASVKQRTVQYTIDEGRGHFVDRNGQPLSFKKSQQVVIFPSIRKYFHEEKKESLTVNPYLVNDSVDEEMNLHGVQINKILPSYQLATQFLGIVGENEQEFLNRYPWSEGKDTQPIGQSGLQKQFDEWLISDQTTKLLYHVDALGQPLFGLDVKYTAPTNPYFPLMIQTTIDKNIQEKLEAYLDRIGIHSGGVLLLDAKRSEILASVSRPKLSIGDPYSSKGIENKMFKQVTPGSVFKMVVLAAAFEEGLIDERETFDCSKDIYGHEEVDRPEGMLTVKESLAFSCNRTFAELSQRLGEKDPALLEKYANKLGLIGGSGWKGTVFHVEEFRQLDEDQGRVFLSSAPVNSERLKETGIGQSDVQVTPLGVASLMNVIANGGDRYSVKGVNQIQFQNGTSYFSFSKQRMDGDGLSPYTTMKLQEYLRYVVESPKGTGHSLRSLPVAVAGKSGTAEVMEEQGNETYHKWFAGYFPFHQPKYVLVVVNENTSEAGISGQKMFYDIVNILYSHE
ncbi:hypothetical protein Q75_10460 [Bacillus coahuilensis p1.1.43]|uniref:serine-type D-Ala-D-Ala carboxypeptidase n=1 Tax=Bacillus coahuilensis p1.1.43 TaxID=1150625 RepID=A0A147K793_9BACI|nr:penicillin-binding transpeptidase domain-containing protein [Bacillus coahuilensis]KUP05926.1 hypothetical protein Q75_10460 [Bacillus coahuilensis p1.1.43]